MYAGQEWTWHEVLADTTQVESTETLPLFLCVFSSDKGTEKWTELAGDDWFSMYGTTADFFRHGQPLSQAHRIIKARGKIFGKRIVAPDSTLSNLIIANQLTNKTEDKLDAKGNKLYIDPTTGQETTDVTDTPATISTAVIKHVTYTVENAKTFQEVITAAEAKLDDDSGIYPLVVITDNGRGDSGKRVKISPDYTLSKNLDFCMYNIEDIENTSTIETKRFTINPDIIYSNQNMSIRENLMTQFQTTYLGDSLNKYVAKLSEYSGYSADYLLTQDILFGCTVKGATMSGMQLDADGVSIDTEYGMPLQYGTNGTFGEAPFGTEAWSTAACAALDDRFSDEIYDLDLHMIDYAMDANYPLPVKAKIRELADFREDFFYFRDMGLDINTYSDVIDITAKDEWVKSKFVGDYLTTYDVIDQYSKKQINVTMMYSLAPLMVAHTINGRSRPLAGEINNMIITEAIEGTINYAPRITPKVNQKQQLDDIRVNFANYSSNKLVIQSLYTSQEKLGPLSYINNVLATQEVIKAIRTYCPKIRFQFQNGSDFTKYKEAVESTVLNKYISNFKSIELVYVQDEIAANQKIFKAALKCYYNNFVQSEKFDVYAFE